MHQLDNITTSDTASLCSSPLDTHAYGLTSLPFTGRSTFIHMSYAADMSLMEGGWKAKAFFCTSWTTATLQPASSEHDNSTRLWH